MVALSLPSVYLPGPSPDPQPMAGFGKCPQGNISAASLTGLFWSSLSSLRFFWSIQSSLVPQPFDIFKMWFCVSQLPFSQSESEQSYIIAPGFPPHGDSHTKFIRHGWLHVCICFITSLSFQFSSVQFSRSIVFHSLWPHGLQHTRPPCSSPTLRVYSNSCPLSRWCHPTISSSVVLFSSRLQSFPSSGSPSFSADFIYHNPSKKFCLSFFSISIQSLMPI